MDLRHLVNYITGECSIKGKEEVEQWLKSDPLKKHFLKSIQKIWDVEPEFKMEIDVDKAWNDFKKENIDQKSTSEEKVSKSIHSNRFDRRYIYTNIAAAAALILIVFFFLSKFDTIPNNAPNEQITIQEIVTDKGEKTKLNLSDGTRVILNSDSRFRISSQFGSEYREVYLEGEAFFDVTKKDETPFTVHSNDSYTKVLGTKFVVSAYPDADSTLVAVSEGKVLIGLNDLTKREGIVEEGNLGILKKDYSPTIKKARDIKEYTSWSEGKLIFKETPLQEIVPRIERWYDISIEVQDSSLYTRELTGVFDNEPLNEVLKVMVLSMDMKFSKEKQKVTFLDNDH